MRKTLISLALCLILVFTLGIGVFAESAILEATDLKIIINGELAEFNDVPIYIGERTLLPLRELLTKLGVLNDDEHIVWNGTEKSVTVYKDDIKLYLKVNSKTAYINDSPYELDTAPVGYLKNQRTYIPARFVCEALGSKVAWEGSTKTVLIRDAEKYAQIEDVLNKSNLAMNEIKKCKMKLDIDISGIQGAITMKVNADMTGEIDREKKKMNISMSMNMLGMEIKTDSYYADGVVYNYNPYNDAWSKKTYTAIEYDSIFANDSKTGILESKDTVCAMLELADSGNDKEILLKGNFNVDNLFEKALSGNGDTSILTNGQEYVFNKYIMEIYIDKNTYLVNRITLDLSANEKETNVTTEMFINLVYLDYNSAFEITVPQEVIESAVEMTNDTMF